MSIALPQVREFILDKSAMKVKITRSPLGRAQTSINTAEIHTGGKSPGK